MSYCIRLCPALWREGVLEPARKQYWWFSCVFYLVFLLKVTPSSIKPVFLLYEGRWGINLTVYSLFYCIPIFFLLLFSLMGVGPSVWQWISVQLQRKMAFPWHWPQLSRTRDINSPPSVLHLSPIPLNALKNGRRLLLSLPMFSSWLAGIQAWEF